MNPSVLIAYIAVRENPLLVSHLSHFVESFVAHPPGYDHRLIIVCNGGPLPPKIRAMLAPIPHGFYIRPNDGGWDISAYMDVANHFRSDLQVCLGESVYSHQGGWLKRVVDCYEKYGEGMYGFFSSFLVRPHLNTTAFAVSQHYLWNYPVPKNKHDRYEFEHGVKSLWRSIAARPSTVKLVTWDGCWEPKDWRKPANILWRGDQSNCLLRCNHLDRYDAATPATRKKWALNADTLVK